MTKMFRDLKIHVFGRKSKISKILVSKTVQFQAKPEYSFHFLPSKSIVMLAKFYLGVPIYEPYDIVKNFRVWRFEWTFFRTDLKIHFGMRFWTMCYGFFLGFVTSYSSEIWCKNIIFGVYNKYTSFSFKIFATVKNVWNGLFEIVGFGRECFL